MIDYKDYKLSNKEWVVMIAICAVITSLLGRLFFGNWIIGLVGLLAIKSFVSLYKLYKIDKRKKIVLGQFKDCLYSFSSSFYSGRHMAEAMIEAEEYLAQIYGKNALLINELRYMSSAIENVKEDDCKLWIDFGRRCCLKDVQDFAEIYSCCRETGGDLREVVNRASKVISDKIDTEKEINTLLSERKFEGRLIALMPLTILVFLNLTAYDYIKIMYETIQGHILMLGVIVIMVFGLFIIERIVRIEI